MGVILGIVLAFLFAFRPTEAVTMSPIKQTGGIFFEHIGTSWVHRGEVILTMNSSLNPSDDIAVLRNYQADIQGLCANLSNLYKDDTCNERSVHTELRKQNLEEVVTSISFQRSTRSIWKMLKEFIFGEDVKEELWQLEDRQATSSRQTEFTLYETINTISKMANRTRTRFGQLDTQ